MPKKISILLPDLRGGGAERVSIDLAQEFSKSDYTIEFVLMQRVGELLNEVEDGFRVVGLASPRMRDVLKKLILYLNDSSTAILFVSMWPLTAVAAAATIMTKGKKPKLILVEHSILSVQYNNKGWLHRLALRSSIALAQRVASYYVGVSTGVAKDIAKLGLVSSGRVSVINNPVPECKPPSTTEFEHASRLWGNIEGCGSRILSVGSFKDAKNFPLLLRAFKRASSTVDLKLMMLGDGQQRMELECLAETLGISDRVIMPGFQADTSSFYHTADLFVLSSNREGLPTVLIEALSAGLPVVSTDCRSGPSEILMDGEFGTLVPVNDEVALSEAIVGALHAQHDKEKLKARARDFAPAVAADKYLRLMRCAYDADH